MDGEKRNREIVAWNLPLVKKRKIFACFSSKERQNGQKEIFILLFLK
jgi:hypothetical protein